MTCKKVNQEHNWQLPGPQSLWCTRYFQEAIELIDKKKYQESLDILENMTKAPKNTGVHSYLDVEEDRRFYHMGRCYEAMGLVDKAKECWEDAMKVPHYVGYENAYWYDQWSKRYYQALALQKMGRTSEANTYFDALELLVHTNEIPLTAKERIIDMVERGRFADEKDKDFAMIEKIEIETRAEE